MEIPDHVESSHSRYRDLRDLRFGRLVAKSHLGKGMWFCVCDCGKPHRARRTDLESGKIKSCGCFCREHSRKMFTTHGKRSSPEYRIWLQMKNRCVNKKAINYKHYGGCGVKVCKRWRDSFAEFLADMGPRPTDKHSLDRFPKKDGPYEPGNVRWATPEEQQSNRKNNRILLHGGQSLTMSQWSRKVGVRLQTIAARLSRGWSVERALTTSC